MFKCWVGRRVAVSRGGTSSGQLGGWSGRFVFVMTTSDMSQHRSQYLSQMPEYPLPYYQTTREAIDWIMSHIKDTNDCYWKTITITNILLLDSQRWYKSGESFMKKAQCMCTMYMTGPEIIVYLSDRKATHFSVQI